jgi:hypothetical protein
MTKPYIESAPDLPEDGPFEISLIVTLSVTDPELLAHVTQQADILDQLEDVFTTNISPQVEGIEVLDVQFLEYESEEL